MTDHTTAAQAAMQEAVLTDDQIEALAKKHIAPHADRLDKLLPHRVPYQQTEQFRRVKALIVDVLSKLRAPVAEDPLGWQISFIDMDGQHKTVLHGHNAVADYRSIDPKASSIPLGPYGAALASAPVAGKTREAEDFVRGGALNFDAYPESVHVADVADGLSLEAQPVAWMTEDGSDAWTDAKKKQAMQHAGKPGARLAASYSVPLTYAAPQASEAVRWMGIDLAANGIADVRNATLEHVAALLETAIPVSHFVFCDSPDGPINRISNRSGQEVMAEAIAAIRALKTDPPAAMSAQPEQS